MVGSVGEMGKAVSERLVTTRTAAAEEREERSEGQAALYEGHSMSYWMIIFSAYIRQLTI